MNQNSYQQTDVLDRNTKYETIMLIDDNPLDNYVNTGLVEKDHFAKNIQVYERAQAALDFLAAAKESSLPDLIFLDINMPEMDGFQFLDQFATLPDRVMQKCRIIMLSTSESFKDLNRANKNKYVYKFLNKPLTEQILTAITI